jgi:glycosyltransferase involved in cell wall biosynthesis
MLITVLTAAYNRAHTLPDVYASLLTQRTDLEWIVVDDGSTDATPDVLAALAARAPFPVRLLRQEHAGVHAARNRGLAAARGELVAPLDSDDLLTPAALDRLAAHWRRARRDGGLAGVSALCADESGRLIGDRFPADVVDATWQEMTYRHRVRGEKFHLVRADVLRAHPYPTTPRGFVGEAAVWRAIGRVRRMRHVNDVARVYRQAGGDRICRRPFAEFAASQAVAHAAVLNDDIAWLRHDPLTFARSAAHLSRALFHRRVPARRQARRLATRRARALWAAMAPVGWLLYLRDVPPSPAHPGVSRKNSIPGRESP